MNCYNGSTVLKTHALTHKNNTEIIKVQLQSERNKKKRKFRKLGATNKKSPEDEEQDILYATVAWVIEENLQINATAKQLE